MNNWRERAACQGEELTHFFEDYEDDKDLAEEIDEMCFDCPVRETCLRTEVLNSGTGVFGGCYLVLGKYSKTRNAHKLKYVADKLQQEVEEIRRDK